MKNFPKNLINKKQKKEIVENCRKLHNPKKTQI